MSAQTPILETKDLRCVFTVRQGLFKAKKPLAAVNGVSLQVRKGEILGLVGESGCGKSTLAKILLGLQEPTAGALLIDGKPSSSFSRIDIARRVQPIFQDPFSSLNPRKTIGDIIALPLRVHKLARRDEIRPKVLEIMDLCGLSKRFYESYPNQLSGGQRQRVAIARALIMRPELVICDEPTSALDVSVQSQILNLLTDLQKELNLTYILISHNLAVVEHMATHVAVMYLGRLVEQAPTDELFRNPRHPYTRALLDSVLTPEPGMGVPDSQLGAAFPNPIDPPRGCTFHPRCPKAMDICKQAAPTPIVSGAGADYDMVECHLYGPQEARAA